MLGAALGYFFLYATARIFFWATKKEGLGQGDLELLAFIGSFTGMSGAWMSLTIGSIFGSIIGIAYLIIMRKDVSVKIPFGPFLATGALLYVLFEQSIITALLHNY
jgi:leader peptidase (prepilin peptidase)/N-methyltransferase